MYDKFVATVHLTYKTAPKRKTSKTPSEQVFWTSVSKAKNVVAAPDYTVRRAVSVKPLRPVHYQFAARMCQQRRRPGSGVF
jgi:hypothetical protein